MSRPRICTPEPCRRASFHARGKFPLRELFLWNGDLVRFHTARSHATHQTSVGETPSRIINSGPSIRRSHTRESSPDFGIGVKKIQPLTNYLDHANAEGCDAPIKIEISPEGWHLVGMLCVKLAITPGQWFVACATYNAEDEERHIEAMTGDADLIAGSSGWISCSGTPGYRFKDGRLMIFTETEVMLIRGWVLHLPGAVPEPCHPVYFPPIRRKLGNRRTQSVVQPSGGRCHPGFRQ